LGWVKTKSNRHKTYEILNQQIPDELKYDMHVLMIRHGRQTCGSQVTTETLGLICKNPKCSGCVLSDICDFGNCEENKIMSKRKRKDSITKQIKKRSNIKKEKEEVEEEYEEEDEEEYEEEL
jgi:hypothetical protein